jgi:hypothetical protein
MCDTCGCGSMAEQMPSPEMFNTDSENTLGTDTSFPTTSAPQVEMNSIINE